MRKSGEVEEVDLASVLILGIQLRTLLLENAVLVFLWSRLRL